MNGVRSFALAAAFAVVLASSVAFSTAGTRPSASFPAGDAKRGEEIAPLCLTCHGATPTQYGDPPIDPPLLRGQRANYIFDTLQDYRSGRRGEPTMKGMAAGLDDQQMRDLAAYLAGPPKPVPKVKLEGSPAHRDAIARCGLCHGESGMGEMQGMPILTGQHAEYMERAMAEYRNGQRTEPTMAAIAKELSPADTTALVRYYAAQTALEPAR